MEKFTSVFRRTIFFSRGTTPRVWRWRVRGRRRGGGEKGAVTGAEGRRVMVLVLTHLYVVLVEAVLDVLDHQSCLTDLHVAHHGALRANS